VPAIGGVAVGRSDQRWQQYFSGQVGVSKRQGQRQADAGIRVALQARKFFAPPVAVSFAEVQRDFTDAGMRITQAGLEQAVAAMRQQLETELADPTLRTPARKVLTSLQEHWSGLTHFVADPRIPMDNNLSERRLRGPALGRKNYYGSGARWSGRLAA